jgi:hypothetical protein
MPLADTPEISDGLRVYGSTYICCSGIVTRLGEAFVKVINPQCVCLVGGGGVGDTLTASANCAHNSSETERHNAAQQRLFSADKVQYQHVCNGILDLISQCVLLGGLVVAI